MGAGASVPDSVDLDTAKSICGDKFDEGRFAALASDGKISRSQFLGLTDPVTLVMEWWTNAPKSIEWLEQNCAPEFTLSMEGREKKTTRAEWIEGE